MAQVNTEPNRIPSKAGSGAYNYTIDASLAEYDVPMNEFRAAHPDINHFIVGGHVFTKNCPNSASAQAKAEATAETKGNPQYKILIMQRAATDSYGGRWDFPGGSAEDIDASLLDGVAREVFEETGYHVSHFAAFVRQDSWFKLYQTKGLVHSAKFTFIVEVHEAATEGWEDRVKLAEEEHSAWLWVTKEELRKSVELCENGNAQDAAYSFVGVQGRTAYEGCNKMSYMSCS